MKGVIGHHQHLAKHVIVRASKCPHLSDQIDKKLILPFWIYIVTKLKNGIDNGIIDLHIVKEHEVTKHNFFDKIFPAYAVNYIVNDLCGSKPLFIDMRSAIKIDQQINSVPKHLCHLLTK